MKSKIVVVGIVGIPACYGGFESLVENLTKYSTPSKSYEVFCSSKSYVEKPKYYNGAKLNYINIHANGVKSIIYDIVSLVRSIFIKPDVTLILGVSGCLFLPVYRFFSKSKVITNIDGLEWRREKWGWFAKRFLKLSEAFAVKFSDVVVSDNQAIANYVKKEYSVDSEIIAYGGDHVISSAIKNVMLGEYYLSLCRIEPENNVEMILECFSKLPSERLIFIGNWSSNEYGRGLKDKYKSFNNIDILDSIYDIEKLFELRMGSKGYVHGHSAGGTNPSLVEAMHFSKPIFAFDCDFNRFSTENSAFYFSSAENLQLILRSENAEAIQNNAIAMKEISSRRYTWAIIAQQYESQY